MAVPVGNLLRRLESLDVDEPDGPIAFHLTMIRKAFDQLQPYVHEAERKRDLYNPKWRKRKPIKFSSKQLQTYQNIANWVSRIAALATEIDHIIISYSLHLCNIKESSTCSKLFNLGVYSVNAKNVSDNIQAFLDHSRAPKLPPQSPSTSQEQYSEEEFETVVKSFVQPEPPKVSPQLKSSYSFTFRSSQKKLQLLRSKSYCGPTTLSLPRPSSTESSQWTVVSPLPDHESSQIQSSQKQSSPKKLPFSRSYSDELSHPRLITQDLTTWASPLVSRSLADNIGTELSPQLLRSQHHSSNQKLPLLRKNLSAIWPPLQSSQLHQSSGEQSSYLSNFTHSELSNPWDSDEDEASEEIFLLRKTPINWNDRAVSPQLQRSQNQSSWDIFSWFRNFTLEVNHDATEVQSQSSVTDSPYSWPKHVLGMGLAKAYGRLSQAVVKNVKEVLIREAVAMSIQSDKKSLLEPNALQMPIQTILESRKTNGRADELRQIEFWLRKANEKSNNVVIGITGMAGTGKTTLATFARMCMQRYFDCHAWVYASRVHNDKRSLLEDVLKGILTSTSVMVPEDMDTIDETILEEMIKRRLTKINFLLILDDVQKPEVLEDVMNVLPVDCKVNIICTSQKHLSKCTHILQLMRLNFQNSLNVLERHVTVREEYFPTLWWHRNAEAQDILSMCEGNLFAISIIGGMLSMKEIGGMEWTKISHLLKETHFIPLSYADLKPVLKSCFLYAASFPSHMEISCKKLQRLWVAEGFVEVGGNITPEAAAKLQLDELIQRNMIQVGQVSPDGGVITCHLLEPMRKFALGRSQEDQFCTIHDYKGSQSLSKAIHRLFLHEEGKISQGGNFDKLNLNQVHSFLAFKGNGQQQRLFVDLFDCRHLSVLELQQVPGNNLPESIGELSLLRYLGLRGTKIKKVPGSLKKLKRLQTLDIRNTFVRELPANLDGLTMLRHLLLAGSFSDNVVNLNAGIEVFKDLQTLAGIKLTDGIVKGLSHLPQLQKLSVGNVKKSSSAYLFQSVEQMKFLNSLTIKCSFSEKIDLVIRKPHENLEKVRIGGCAKHVIDWVSKLHALKHLHLWDSKLDKDPFPALERLPNLFVLSLCNAYDGETIHFSPEGFPNLKKLSILHCRRLNHCTKIEDGAMEKLQMLIIAYCPKLSKLPEGMDKLTSLEALHVSNMSMDFINEARYTNSLMEKRFSLHIQDTAQFAPPAQVTKRLPVLMPAQRFRKMESQDPVLMPAQRFRKMESQDPVLMPAQRFRKMESQDPVLMSAQRFRKMESQDPVYCKDMPILRKKRL